MINFYQTCMALAASASLLFALGAQAQETPAASPPTPAPKPAASEPAAAESAPQAPSPAVVAPPVEAEPQPQVVSVLEEEMIGGIDWEEGIVYAVGDGIPPTNAVNPAQARARAKRAALDEAMARLLEMVQSVRVDAESTTRDFINESRAVNTAVSGLVRNAEVEEMRQLDDGSFQIKMRMPIHGANGLSRTLLPEMLNRVQQVNIVTRTVRSDSSNPPPTETMTNAAADKSATPFSDAPYTGVIIDATATEAAEAIYPTILSQSGEVLYGLTEVDPNVAALQGICAYRQSLDKAKRDKRAGANPLVLNALEASGSGGANLVLSDEDAAKLAELKSAGGILRDGKVIVVTN